MNSRNKTMQLFMNIIFYIMLVILIISLIYPHTSLYYRTGLFSPFFISLNSEDLYMLPGETFRLRINSINKKATYQSDDFRVCHVSINGTLKAKRVGTAIIKVKVSKKVLKCRVHVIKINKKSIIIKTKRSYTLKVRGVHSKVRWSSKNPFVASVNLRGKVTAKKRGTTVIRGRVKGKIVTCTVIVY